jgi:hypothetical protein
MNSQQKEAGLIEMKNILIKIFVTALIVTACYDACAQAKQASQDSVALFGVWTPLRFNRGQLDDVIPGGWDLGFFEKEREGLNRCLKQSFSTMLPDDLGYKVVPPDQFERLAVNMQRKIYTSYNIDDVNKRFDWAAADAFAEMLNVRYAMFGDVTALDISNTDSVKLEMNIIVYDSELNRIVYMQKFANDGRMAQELPASTLRRSHPKMDEDMVWFLRNPLGRAALIIYDDFASTLSGQAQIDFANAVQDVTISDATPIFPTPGPGVDRIPTQDFKYPSADPCTTGGAILVVSTSVNTNALRFLACRDGVFEIVQARDIMYPTYNAGVRVRIGHFQKPGEAMLALAHSVANDDMRVFPFQNGQFQFDVPFSHLEDFFSGYKNGIFMETGDFDGDGIDELVGSTTYDRNELAVFGYEKGRMAERQRIASPLPGYASGLVPAAGDFDGDGTDELALCTTVSNDEVRVYKSADGMLDMSQPMAELIDVFPGSYGDGCYAIGGDLDGDGRDELIVTKKAGNSDLVIYKYANGRFTVLDSHPQAVPTYEAGLTLAAADFDKDGRDELVIGYTVANDEARILKFRNGSLDIANPMAHIKDIFPDSRNGLLLAAGDIPQFWE